jgi:hypothetical protein
MSKTLPHVRIPCSWIRDEGSKLSTGAFRLYLVMLSYRDKDTAICYTGQEKLGELIGITTTRHIRNLVVELEQARLIKLVKNKADKKVKSKYRTNQYYVHNPMNIHLF